MYYEYGVEFPSFRIDKFKTSKSYHVGDIVYHNSKMYVCIRNVVAIYLKRPFSYDDWREYIEMPKSDDTNLDTQSLIDELNVHYNE